MTLDAKSLADGDDVDTVVLTALYTCPLGKRAIVKRAIFYNDSGTTRYVLTAVLKDGATVRHWSRVEIPAGGFAVSLIDVPLEENDEVQAVAGGADVRYTVFGAERDAEDSTIEGQILATGACSGTPTTIYTVPTGSRAFITQLRIAYGGSSGSPTVQVFVLRNGSSARQVSAGVVPINGCLSFLRGTQLGPGDIVQLSGSSTDPHYILVGAEEVIV